MSFPANPCTMLPPLRSLPAHPSASASLTLSDCSDLSISHQDDLTNLSLSNTIPTTTYIPFLPTVPHSTPNPHTPPTPHPYHLIPATPIHNLNPNPNNNNNNNTISHPAHPRITKRIPRNVARPRHNNRNSPTRISAASNIYKPAPPKKVRSSKSNIPGESRYWTPSEHKLFVEALLKYGPKDLKSISAYVGTRNMIQCRTHEQKCFMRLMREAQRETFLREGQDWDSAYGPNKSADVKSRLQKDVYSVPPSCGLTLLCVVGEEMQRSLQL